MIPAALALESASATFPGRYGDFFLPVGSEPFRDGGRAEHVFLSGIASE